MKATIALITIFGQFAISPACDVVPFELFWGSCPRPDTVNNFNPPQFVGTWYNSRQYKNTIFRGRCGQFLFTWNPDYQVLLTNYTSLENANVRITLSPVNLTTGVFDVYRDGYLTPLVWHLLDTDYENYAVTWTCYNLFFGLANTQTLNVLARNPNITQEALTHALEAIKSRNLDIGRLRIVVQDEFVCRRNSSAELDVRTNSIPRDN